MDTDSGPGANRDVLAAVLALLALAGLALWAIHDILRALLG
jgi:hypothetical protein